MNTLDRTLLFCLFILAIAISFKSFSNENPECQAELTACWDELSQKQKKLYKAVDINGEHGDVSIAKQCIQQGVSHEVNVQECDFSYKMCKEQIELVQHLIDSLLLSVIVSTDDDVELLKKMLGFGANPLSRHVDDEPVYDWKNARLSDRLIEGFVYTTPGLVRVDTTFHCMEESGVFDRSLKNNIQLIDLTYLYYRLVNITTKISIDSYKISLERGSALVSRVERMMRGWVPWGDVDLTESKPLMKKHNIKNYDVFYYQNDTNIYD